MIFIINPRYVGYHEVPLMEVKGMWGTVYFDEKFIPITEKVIPGIYDDYIISNYGKVYNKYTGKMLKYMVRYGNGNPNKPYCYISILTSNGSKSYAVHRLVMACFYPQLGPITQKMDINHKSGVTNDNYISYNDPTRGNIEWMSHRDNMLHVYATGLCQVGEDNVHTKISNDTAQKIINLLLEHKYTSKQICEIVGEGATPHIVDDIRKKQCWNHLIPEDAYFYQKPWRQFTGQDIHNFCRFFQDNPKTTTINDLCRDALIYNGFEPSDRYVETLRKIYVGKYYKYISSNYCF